MLPPHEFEFKISPISLYTEQQADNLIPALSPSFFCVTRREKTSSVSRMKNSMIRSGGDAFFVRSLPTSSKFANQNPYQSAVLNVG